MTAAPVSPPTDGRTLSDCVGAFVRLVQGIKAGHEDTDSVLKAILTAAGYEVDTIEPVYPRPEGLDSDEDEWPNPPYRVTETNRLVTSASEWLSRAWECASYPRNAYENVTKMVLARIEQTTALMHA